MATGLPLEEELGYLAAELQESNEYLKQSEVQNRLLIEQNRLLRLTLDSATATHGRRDEEAGDWDSPNRFEGLSPMSFGPPTQTFGKMGDMEHAEFQSRLYGEVQPQGASTSRQSNGNNVYSPNDKLALDRANLTTLVTSEKNITSYPVGARVSQAINVQPL